MNRVSIIKIAKNVFLRLLSDQPNDAAGHRTGRTEGFGFGSVTEPKFSVTERPAGGLGHHYLKGVADTNYLQNKKMTA